MRQMDVRIAPDGKTAMPAPQPVHSHAAKPAAAADSAGGSVERALVAAIRDTARIGDLLDALKSAQLWLPLPDDGRPVISGTAVTLPMVSYLGGDFVPAYSSPEMLQKLAEPDREIVPHAVVRAADLARLLPGSIGIALNAGANESVPIYPEGVAYLATDDEQEPTARISLGPPPISPDSLLAGIGAGLRAIPQARESAAAWLSVQFAGEGLLIAVSLDDPADEIAKDAVVTVVERAASMAPPEESGFPIDVTFPGERQPDYIDQWFAAFAAPFYRR